jgi:IS5 family transposase
MHRSFAEYDGFRKQREVTRREAILTGMEGALLLRRLEELTETHYPFAGKGRKP